ncbi:MAG: patatin-like phospholipase family protein [Acidobacteria bacterium]|nr:MAG: patatin-like phospholipase family protein [Acidobacteriota bacterium]
MHQLIRWLDARTARLEVLASRWGLALLFVLCLVLSILFQVVPPGAIETLDGDRDGYTASQAHELLGGYSDQQRRQYARRELSLDVVFPIAYSLLFFAAITFCLKPAIEEKSRVHGLRHLPWLGGLLDLGENVSAATLAWTFDSAEPGAWWLRLAGVASHFSAWKWRFALVSLLLVVLSAAAYVVNGGFGRGGATRRGVRQTLRRLLYALQYLYFQRVPLLFFLILWGLSGGALAGSATLAGGLETRSALYLFFTAATAVYLAWLIVSTFSLIWRQGPVRYGVAALWYPFTGTQRHTVVLLACALAVSAPPLWAIVASRPDDLRLPTALLSIAVAAAAILGTLTLLPEKLLELLQWVFARPMKSTAAAWIKQRLSAVARFFGPGYWDETTGQIAAGQVRAVVGFVVLGVIYAVVYLWWGGDPPVRDEPAGAFVFLFLALMLSAIAGVAFLLDRFHVPVLITLVAIFFTLYGIKGTDHYFELKVGAEDRRPIAAADAVRARLAATGFSQRNDARPILVVVAIRGGGIQAAAWTGEVLSGLEQQLAGDPTLTAQGIRFLDSVHLLSSVSGGSVGALNLLAAMEEHGATGAWTDEELERLRQATRRSSLASLGWGLVYPEFLRVLLPFYDERKDRGWALEHAWRQTMKTVLDYEGRAERGRWAEKVAKGELPAMIFNATIAETGAPLFITPLDTARANGRRDFGLEQLVIEDDPRFLDLDMVTAARLSANFPYAGPPTAPRCTGGPCPQLAAYHLLDGAYFDNFGIAAVVSWLEALHEATDFDLAEYFGAVAVLELRAFPPEEAMPPPRAWWTGALAELIAPARGVVAMRTTSQVVRNEIEVDYLCAILEHGHGRTPIPCRRFIFQPGPDSGKGPLSWHLRRADVEEIERAWQRIVEPRPQGPSPVADLLDFMRENSAGESSQATEPK